MTGGARRTDTTPGAGRSFRVRRAAGFLPGRVLAGGWRCLSWPFRSTLHLVVGMWLTGFFIIGQGSAALADDGLINSPDLGSAGGQTVFELYGPQRFSLYLQLSDSNHGAPYVSESMWNFLRAIESALMYLVGALARGAITSMEWMLNLNIYSDNSATIDAAVRSVAAQVFWPLFGATMAIGAFAAYARMKREGGGSLFNDASWLVAASIFAGAFAISPSTVMTDLDNARAAVGVAAMTGYASVGPTGTSAAGFPAVSLPGDQNGATRKLADAMWNVYVVTPWCYVNYNSMTICADIGHDYLTGDARWVALTDWMAGNNGGNSDDTNGSPYCPPELAASCDWIRGQSFGRLGATIFVVAVTIPLVVMLLALVLFGIMAIVGFALLVLLGLFFIIGWMIPGRLRQMGVRWFEELLGALLQNIIITAVLGSVMVLDAILNAGIGKYGFFMVGLLNLASFVVGFRMRGRLENIAGLGAGGSASPFSGYMAMRALGGIGKSATRMTRGALTGAAAATPVLAGAAVGAAYLGGRTALAGARGAASAGHLLRNLPNNLIHSAGLGAGGGVAPPYRPAGPGIGPGRKVISPTPRPGHGGRAQQRPLPPGAGSTRGRTRALEAPGIGAQSHGGRRVYVAASTPTPPRTFAPSGDGPRSRAAGRLDETPGICGAGPARPTTTGGRPPIDGARPYRASPRSLPPGPPATRRPDRTPMVSPPTRRTPTPPPAAPETVYPTSRLRTGRPAGRGPLPHQPSQPNSDGTR